MSLDAEQQASSDTKSYDFIDFLADKNTEATEATIDYAAKVETARFTDTLAEYVQELYQQGGNDAINAWAPFLEGAARSDNEVIAALQKGGSALTAALEKLPSLHVVGEFKVGPIDGVVAVLNIYNAYRHKEDVFGASLKETASVFGSGLAGAAATAIVAGGLGVAATALAPVVIGGAVSIAVGLAIDKAWDHYGASITNWTEDKLAAARDGVVGYAQEFDQWASDQYDNLSNYVSNTTNAFNDWLNETARSASDMADYALAHAAELGADAVKFFEDARDAAADDVAAARDQIAGWGKQAMDSGRELWDGAKAWADDAFNYAKDHLSDFTSASQDWLSDRFKDLGNLTADLGNGISGILEAMDPRQLLSQGADAFLDELKSLFGTAEITRSPIIIDLDGDGVETLGLSQGIHFDHDRNGFAELTGWVAPDDGLLVFDRNANGKIDDGSELFGSYTPDGNDVAANGFLALKSFDTNNDGVVSDIDANFAKLQVWRDLNSDGVVESGEFFSLSTLGIKSLSVVYSDSDLVDSSGNQHREIGTYTKSDGSTAAMEDVWFAVDTARTQDSDVIDVSTAIADLPDIQGFGDMHSLHQAMAHDTSGELQALVGQFIAETDPDKREAILLDLIYHWAGVQDIDPESRAATQIYGNVIGDARKLATLEAFLGEDYLGTWCWGERDPNPHGPAAKILLQAFSKLEDFVSGQLLAQSQFSDILGSVKLSWSADLGALNFDVTDTLSLMKQGFGDDFAQGMLFFHDLAEAFKLSFGDGVLDAIRQHGTADGSQFEVALASFGLASTIGDGTDNTIYGIDTANDALFGLAGNDGLYGGGGDDILDGGKGNDYLSGGDGADIYVYKAGDGNDTIYNYDTDAAGAKPDVLKIQGDITPSDVQITRSYYDLVLVIGDSGEKITIQSFFDQGGNSPYAIDKIVFDNGTQWTIADVMAVINKPTTGDDYIFGSASGDTVDALAGNDIVWGGSGDDTIAGGADQDWLYGEDGDDKVQGGDASDYLYGNDGDDELVGGKGGDYLEGGAGSDTYRFARGDGQDQIYNYDTSGAAKTDVIAFDAGLAPADVTIRREGSDLVLSISGSDDSLRVSGYFYGQQYQVDAIRFSDGTTWDQQKIEELARTGTTFNDYLVGTDAAETLSGFGGDDTIHGAGGHDSLSGGASTDYVYGEDGDDDLSGGTGSDYLEGGYGSDTYQFGVGDGQDRIYNYAYSAYDTAGKVDTLSFGDGILASAVTARRDGNDLLLSIVGGDDQVRVEYYFAGQDYRLDQIRFADGTTWGFDHIQTLVLQGTDQGDYLVGTDAAETLDGLGGDDAINGGGSDDSLLGGGGSDNLDGNAGNDTLSGGADTDYLYGEDGDDDLTGGTGSDHLEGGYGSDIYRFDLGGGHDTIYNYAYSGYDTAGKVDTLSFGDNILAATMSARRDGDDLVLSITDSNDEVRVQSYFSGQDYRLDQIRFADGTSWDYSHIQALVTQGTDGDDYLMGTDAAETLTGLGGNDTIHGVGGNDSLSGGAGTDYVYGEDGDDDLSGGMGSDYLSGGYGSDTYRFGFGDGQDTIYNYAYSGYDTAGKVDTLAFGEGILSSIVVARRSGNDLVLSIDGTTDQVTVQYYFSGQDYRVDQIRFADGSIWDYDHIQSLVMQGTQGGDYLVGTDGAETLSGLGGDDTIYGGAGNDSLSAGAGTDYVYGEDGDDELSGGAGSDYLTGGNGSDTYRFGLGDGQDTIYNYAYSGGDVAGKVDVLSFNDGVLASAVLARRNGDDLILSIEGTDDRVTVQYYFSSQDYRLDQIRFTDGTIWDYAHVQTLAMQGSDGNDYLVGTDAAETLRGLAGDDTIYAGGGNDSVAGGDGNDTLNGDDGDDMLDGGEGGDYLTGGGGHDSLSGGAGDDAIYANDGNDMLEGGAGNDYLSGGNGSDTYRFGLGDGQDTIYNYAYSGGDIVGKVDTLFFGDGILASAVMARRDGDSLVLSLDGTDDQVTVQYYFSSQDYRLDQIRFADHTTWDYAHVQMLVTQGTDGNDDLVGTDAAETLSGLGGDDTIRGAGGNDSLSGGAGADYVYGEDGDDDLSGDAGSDYLEGGIGSDIYRFGLGDGHDAINNYAYSGDDVAGKVDTLVFGDGILASAVTARRDGDSLVLSIAGTNDQVTVQNYFYSEDYLLDQIHFADGSTWDRDHVQTLVTQGTDGNDDLVGTDAAETLSGLGGDDAIRGAGGDDSLSGGAGADYVYGEDGDDDLSGGAGSDYLEGGNGSDTYRFGLGDGHDTIYNYAYSGDDVAGKVDTLVFGDGILASAVTARRDGGNLLLSVAGTDDVTVQYYFTGRDYLLDQIRFADGSTWDRDHVQTLVAQGTEDSDDLVGTDAAETLSGLGGDDTIRGGGGNDSLSGGAGADYVYGESGDDDLSGGAGADYLEGGNGSDTYRFGLGGGRDAINNYAYSGDDVAGKVDALIFGGGILSSAVTARRDGDDLLLSVAGGTDQVTVENYFYSEDYQLDQIRFADGSTWDYDHLQTLVKQGTDDDDYLVGTDAAETLSGLAGDDTIYGANGNDSLSGGTGDDAIHADDGDDELSGGAGADYLEGGNGSDTYRFNLGDGKDTINNYAYSGDDVAGKLDTLVLGDGILASAVTARRDGDDLLLSVAGGTDQVTVENYFYSEDYRLDQIRFADGSTWDDAHLQTLVKQGTDDDDYLVGTDAAETLSGLAGDDTIYGANGNDSLSGGTGDDAIHADDGDDELSGGAGADDLEGGNGSDTYRFNLGDGKDTINNYAYSGDDVAGKVDALVFGDGILASAVTARRDGDDLVLSIAGDTDQVTVEYYFYGHDYQLDQLRFADGSTWDYDHLQTLVKQGTDDDDYLVGTDAAETLSGLAGDDTIYGANGNDSLSGGTGDDTIHADDGDDELSGGAGADDLEGGNGSDTYRFNLGDGKDTINNYAYSGDDVAGKVDTLVFGDGILASAVTARRKGGDLILSVAGNTDQVTVEGYFHGEDYQLDQIRFADGSTWSRDDVSTQITIDKNNAPTDIQLSGTTIAESAQRGAVIGKLTAVDPDKDNVLTFSFVDNPNNTFAIDGDKLVLADGKSLDFETKSSYPVTLQVTDGGGLTYDEAFTIRVTDVVEPVIGTLKDDSLTGTSGDDIIISLKGSDVLEGLGGSDELDGGAGTDTASYAHARAGVVASLIKPVINKGDAAGDSYLNIENLRGSKFADKLTGDKHGNVIDGGRGDDALAGGASSDIFVFGAKYGKDTIADFHFKGSSHDIIDLSDVAGIGDFKDLVQHHLKDVGNDLMISATDGSKLIIEDVDSIKSLIKADFLF